MEFSARRDGRTEEIIALFSATFADAEGPEEGRVIGDLVHGLLCGTEGEDFRVFSSWEGGAITGCAVFTPLVFDGDDRTVFILSPMAVRTREQGRGVGQALLKHALDTLRNTGVDVVITYGDPAFYTKVGFARITTAIAPPPQPLSQPEGWLGQSLTQSPLTPLRGRSRCAGALDNPDYW